ncbi:MAG: helix-turn-helix domain-containing protein [Thiobacillus sp.]
MSEIEQSSIGQVLRDAREAQGLTLEEAAARLRLMQRQIVAMEADEFESLGQPVFARGFVRNYSRLLGLEPETLLAKMEGAPSEPSVVSYAEPPQPRSWLSSPWLILLLLGVLVVVTVPVTLYWWLNEGEDELVSRVQSVERVDPVPLPPRPVAAPVEAAAPVAEPAPLPPVEAASPVTPAPAMPVAPAAPAPIPAAVPGEAGAPAAPASPVLSGVLKLEFGDEAWVEIKDASGRMLHRQLNPAGSSVSVRGQPPFDLVIGNAAQARMTYNGRPIDLKPFIGMTVARFTLEE